MAKIKPFQGFRPSKENASKVAAKPYDVLNSEEARNESAGNSQSFYRVNKPEVDLSPDVDLYADIVYETAKKNLNEFIANGTLLQDRRDSIYIYRQIMPAGICSDHELSQTGLVVCSAVQDYFDDIIKKHEYTRPVKENDRIKHMETIGAHVGPVFITYPDVADIDALVEKEMANEPHIDFIADDNIRHTIWQVDHEPFIEQIVELFATEVPYTYIADGHHRAASSAKVGKKLAEKNPNHTGKEDYNHFLSVLFPASQLTIIDYNRVIQDLNGHTKEELLLAIGENFHIEYIGPEPHRPSKLHEFSLYIDGSWYKMIAKEGTYNDNDPIGVLDVTILSEKVLDPIFGITDQRTDKRIDFVGGIRGLQELANRVDSGEMACAFALYAVSIQQLINIADSGNVMPPKSTWFEPKLRSGLLVHKFN